MLGLQNTLDNHLQLHRYIRRPTRYRSHRTTRVTFRLYNKLSEQDKAKARAEQSDDPNAAQRHMRDMELKYQAEERARDARVTQAQNEARRCPHPTACSNGKGRETPVADAATLVEIAWLLPAGKQLRLGARGQSQCAACLAETWH